MSLKIFTSLALHALRGAIVWFDQRSDVIGLFFFKELAACCVVD